MYLSSHSTTISDSILAQISDCEKKIIEIESLLDAGEGLEKAHALYKICVDETAYTRNCTDVHKWKAYVTFLEKNEMRLEKINLRLYPEKEISSFSKKSTAFNSLLFSRILNTYDDAPKLEDEASCLGRCLRILGCLR